MFCKGGPRQGQARWGRKFSQPCKNLLVWPSTGWHICWQLKRCFVLLLFGNLKSKVCTTSKRIFLRCVVSNQESDVTWRTQLLLPRPILSLRCEWSVVSKQQKVLEEVFPLKVFWVDAFPDEDFPIEVFQVEVFPLVMSDKSRYYTDCLNDFWPETKFMT